MLSQIGFSWQKRVIHGKDHFYRSALVTTSPAKGLLSTLAENVIVPSSGDGGRDLAEIWFLMIAVNTKYTIYIPHLPATKYAT